MGINKIWGSIIIVIGVALFLWSGYGLIESFSIQSNPNETTNKTIELSNTGALKINKIYSLITGILISTSGSFLYINKVKIFSINALAVTFVIIAQFTTNTAVLKNKNNETINKKIIQKEQEKIDLIQHERLQQNAIFSGLIRRNTMNSFKQFLNKFDIDVLESCIDKYNNSPYSRIDDIQFFARHHIGRYDDYEKTPYCEKNIYTVKNDKDTSFDQIIYIYIAKSKTAENDDKIKNDNDASTSYYEVYFNPVVNGKSYDPVCRFFKSNKGKIIFLK